ncbi:MAG: alkane 1-monooxygenase [Beijerinckiaceae bacterium]|nr:alkane 1-monooxygenase [Beijerinckiaceae bacterium]
MNAFLVANAAALLAGGWWLWIAFIAVVVFASPADEVFGDDRPDGSAPPEKLLTALLYLTLPLLALNCFIFVHYWAKGDPTHFLAFLRWFGIDFDAARTSISAMQLAGGFFSIGIYIGAAGTNVAHELIHRTADSRALLVGRWLLAFSFDTTFSIEHVHGHHRYVATERDPATARRGETVFGFAVRSFVMGNVSAFRIEAERLDRLGIGATSLHNRAITGQFISAFLVGIAALIGGAPAALVFIVCALQGKFYLEAVNYVEHYGLVRVPGSRVEARHSWNCYRTLSSAILYNLPRHSHHHRYAAKPFWSLEQEAEGPVLPHGYLTMILFALVPPLFKLRMKPLLEAWDRDCASDAERDILTRAGTLAILHRTA